MIDDYNDLVMHKKFKRVLVLVNIEPLRLVVVSPKDDLGKHGMR